MKDKYDCIIIGAGIGGLICGCKLQNEGKRLLIIEKNDRVGGSCVSFKRKGFIVVVAIVMIPVGLLLMEYIKGVAYTRDMGVAQGLLHYCICNY